MIKHFSIILCAVLLSLISLSFVVQYPAVSVPITAKAISAKAADPLPMPSPMPSPTPVLKSVYDSLNLDDKGLSREAFEYATIGFDILQQQGKLKNESLITIADFSIASNKKRLFVIDLEEFRVLYHTFVSHGRNTGREMATSFSNISESFQSSPGFYVTTQTYQGKNGYSLKLQGMERGINDKALDRGIVMHGAPYVSQAIANAQGYVGRSQGCPAVPQELARPIINTIRNGSCLFIYHPSYVKKSSLLRGNI